MTTHHLKTIQPFYEAIYCGAKPFEIRVNDRNFRPGDKLVLQEFDPTTGYSGREIEKLVSYVFNDTRYGIMPGYVVLGLKDLTPPAPCAE